MPIKTNSPGCRCCGNPDQCCSGTQPSFIDVTMTGVTGTATPIACQHAGYTCANQWNVTAKRLTFFDHSSLCGASLVDQHRDICSSQILTDCLNVTRFWNWRIVYDGTTWFQRLTVSVFSPYDPPDVVVFEHSYGPTQPTCAAIDLDQTLSLVDDQSLCCDFGSVSVSTTRVA